MSDYLIIVNPISGRGRGKKLIDTIHQTFQKHGLSYSLVETTIPWSAAGLAVDGIKQGYKGIIAAGGDGTANEVLNGFMIARKDGPVKTKMGILSLGGGNDFAYSMKMPKTMDDCCQTYVNDSSKLIDVGFVRGGFYPEGRYFGNGIGIGFDASVGFEAVKLTKVPGFVGYTVSAVKSLFIHYHSPLLELSIDGKTVQDHFLMVSVMNGTRMGGGFHMAPTSLQDDGILDLCVVSKLPRSQALNVIYLFTKGEQETHPNVNFYQAKRLSVRAIEGTMPVHADGETVATRADHLEVEILPKQIEVYYDPTT